MMKKVLLLPLVALLASTSVADAHPGWRGGYGGGWHRGGGGFGRGFAGGVVGGLVGGALMNGLRGGYGGYGYGGYGGYGGGYTYAYPPAVITPPAVVVPQTGGVTTCFNNGYTQTCNTTPQMPYVTTYPSVVPGYPVPY